MSLFKPEPPFLHGKPPAGAPIAVVLCNLGSPDAPTAPAVRRYLAEFLSDPRVVEIPRLIWWLILHGVVLRIRPRRSASKYASIWLPEGSPLKVWTEKQATLLRGYLGQRGRRITVRYAMRYGNPSIGSVLDQLHADGAQRILVLPLYPQYSATTTASMIDAVQQWSRRIRHLPEFRFVNRFHDDAGYIAAVARRVSQHWAQHGRPDKLLMSFHGLPHRSLELGDPYHCECHKTARLVGERLGIPASDLVITFQSRFGRARWLQPYTQPTLIELARSGVKRVDVVCPGFVGDCLETLEEISIEARAAFLGAGGETFNYLPCLNDQHEWIHALSDLTQRHLQGWPDETVPLAIDLRLREERARARGAAD